MQDRFKFRLYDKAIGEMVYDVCVGFIKDSGKTDDWVCADTSCGQITYRDDKLKDIILMQCTGLRDKNGKLIYEGDIINIWCKNFTKNQISEVKFCKERAAFTFDYNTDLGNIVPCTMEKTEIEVIGNIYENPDLLKVA